MFDHPGRSMSAPRAPRWVASRTRAHNRLYKPGRSACATARFVSGGRLDIATLSVQMAQSTTAAAKIAYPFALTAAALELMFLWWVARRRHSLQQAGLSLLMGLGYARAAALGGLLWGWLFFVCYEARLTTLALDRWWHWALLFVLVDFCFYWQHRWAHDTRWGWASHVQHHSVEQFNMTSPFRLSVTSAISGYQVFYAPIALLGFHPAHILVMVLANVTLQVFVHTETVRRLGVLEWFMNTPSHHRVHHASNDIYLDRNLGGLFIVWDRLFGTFQPERDDVPVRYGLVHPIVAVGFWRQLGALWFREWGNMAHDVRRARSWRERIGYAFGAPGWTPQRAASAGALPLPNLGKIGES
ncbi:MAG: sterol desaturase family protein [Caldimonas sp.]